MNQSGGTERMKKCIVTVLGEDTVGIIAKVCTYLAENEINILDISQTIVQGYFNMMMIVDVANLKKDIREDIFNRFVQEDKSLNRKNEGSGIGLALVKSLVELHDGEVYLENARRSDPQTI